MTEARLLPTGELPRLSRRDTRLAERARRGPVRTVLRWLTEAVLVIGTAVLISWLIKAMLVQAFFIPSPSMEGTLIRGDRVVVSKLTPALFDLRRGDVVVFEDPGGWLDPVERPTESAFREGARSALTTVGLMPNESQAHLVKRLIGLPGDTVACCDARQRVTVNGVGIDEPYIYAGDDPSSISFSVVVPVDKLWMMGDHRSVSEDSRYHPDLDNGMVAIDKVVGKAVVTVWPLDRRTWLRNPSAAFASVPTP